jgi:tRNA(Ile)-lysidine synthase
VEALERLVLAGSTGDRIDLPRGVRAVRHRETLDLSPAVQQASLPDEPAMLRVPGSINLGQLCVTASSERPLAGVFAEVDANAVGSSLTIRRRSPGDRFQPLGMEQEKKLQDFFTDAHVPRDARDAVPLFVAQSGIVWVGGLRVAEWAKARPPRPTIYLSFRSV